MPKKISKTEFIERSNIVHDSRYDYSAVVYVSSRIKIKIKCKKHALEFSQTPSSHMQGFVGCTKCCHEKTKRTNMERYGVENPFQSEDIKKIIKQTNLEKRGFENAQQSEKIREKTKQTNMERYGGTSPAHSLVVVQKAKQTKLKKYGDVNYNNRFLAKQTSLERYDVEHAQQTDKVKQKIKETNNILYGGNAPANSEKVRDKMRSTCRERYNVDNIMQSEVGKSQLKAAMIEKFGVDNPQKLPAIQAARRETSRQRYNVDHPSQQHISKDSLDRLDNKEWLYEQHIVQQLPGNYIADYLNVTPRTVYLRLKKFNIPIQNFYSSVAEREIVDFISLYYDGEILTNNRTIIPPYEIDIFIPFLNIGIEFNGIYWHGEQQGKDKNYHLNKTRLCEKKNISLMHIWEHQWEEKKEIVKSIILSKISKLPNKLDARKCTISIISSTDARIFMIQNHIQGATNTSINLGLYYGNKLVSAMTFSKSRYDKTIQYELVRFASILYTNVRGAATKLFSYFKKEFSPTTVISYSDINRNNGDVYKYMGFQYSHDSSPGFSYVHPNKKTPESRIKYQKHKLKHKLELYDESISAWQNMQNNGFDRIWDCGNKVFVWCIN